MNDKWLRLKLINILMVVIRFGFAFTFCWSGKAPYVSFLSFLDFILCDFLFYYVVKIDYGWSWMFGYQWFNCFQCHPFLMDYFLFPSFWLVFKGNLFLAQQLKYQVIVFCNVTVYVNLTCRWLAWTTIH